MVQFPNVPLQAPSHSPEPAAQAGRGWRREEEAFPWISGVMEGKSSGNRAREWGRGAQHTGQAGGSRQDGVGGGGDWRSP